MNKSASASKGSTQSTPVTTADLANLANSQQVHEGFAAMETTMRAFDQVIGSLIRQGLEDTKQIVEGQNKLAAGIGKIGEGILHTQKEVTSAKDTVVHQAHLLQMKVDAKATELSAQIKAMDEALKAALAPKTEIPVQRTTWGKIKHFAGKALPLLGAAAAVFPIHHGVAGFADAFGELSLGQAHFLADGS
jgi:uncharacterized phage infection (PIP) family protein YhgE